jgi:glycosyltransferase involved in cell wall biosynthesis
VAAQKDHVTLAKAAARVAAAFPQVHFLVVGALPSAGQAGQPYYEEVRAFIDSAGLGPHFTFTGYRSDASRLMAATDIVVLCTHVEGLPLVILEAMAHGKPVVATAVDGIPEIIEDGVTGLMHAPGDAGQLGDRLLSLLKDTEAASRLGKRGQQLCLARFNEAQFAQTMAAYYRDILRAMDWRRFLAKRLRGHAQGEVR